MAQLFLDGVVDVERYEPGFRNMAMWDQLSRVIDSASARQVAGDNFRQVTIVHTDDCEQIAVTPRQASLIKKLVIEVPSQKRATLFKQMQNSVQFLNLLALANKVDAQIKAARAVLR